MLDITTKKKLSLSFRIYLYLLISTETALQLQYTFYAVSVLQVNNGTYIRESYLCTLFKNSYLVSKTKR